MPGSVGEQQKLNCVVVVVVMCPTVPILIFANPGKSTKKKLHVGVRGRDGTDHPFQRTRHILENVGCGFLLPCPWERRARGDGGSRLRLTDDDDADEDENGTRHDDDVAPSTMPDDVYSEYVCHGNPANVQGVGSAVSGAAVDDDAS